MITFNGILIDQPLTTTDHLFGMMDYLSSMVTPEGAMRRSYTDLVYWKDCRFAFLAQTLLSGRLHPKYRSKVKAGLEWIHQHQENGMWYDSYNVDSTPEAGIDKCSDWGQCIPIICLALYSGLFGEDQLVCEMADGFLLGLDTFIQNNYNPTVGLYATCLVSPDWKPSGKYEAKGQAVVYMALQAAYSLTGTLMYKQMAQQLFKNFGDKLYSKTLGFYKSSLDNETDLDLQALGVSLWAFGSNLPYAGECTVRAASWVGPDGRVKVPGYPTVLTQNNVWMALALKVTGTQEAVRQSLLPPIMDAQINLYPNPLYGDGGVQDIPGVPALPVFLAAGAALVLSEEPCSILWWP